MRTAHWFAALAAAVATSAFATVVGPVFPPPGGHTFSGSGSPNDGLISRTGGKTFSISAPLATTTPLYFGPQGTAVRLDFIDPGLGNEASADQLTYSAADSNLAGGIAVWKGNTTFASGQPVFTRFVVTTAAPLVLATDLGLPATVGVVTTIGAGATVTINHRFDASYDNVSWQPALELFDAYQGAKTGARSSYSFGYYYDNTSPTITDIADVVLNPLGTSTAMPFTIGDGQTDAASLVVTASSSDQGVVPDANILLGGSGTARTIQVTLAGSGTTTITVTVSDGFATATDTFTVTSNTAPSLSDTTDKVTQKNTASAPIAFTVDDAQTGAASLAITATSSNQALVPDANIVQGGSGTSRTLTITPVTGQIGSATITVTATDPGGLFTTDTFVLIVNAPPRFTVNTGFFANQGATVTVTNAMLRAVDDDGADSQITFTLDPALGATHAGTLKRNGVALANSSTFTQQDINDGLLTYTHDDSCIDSDSFVFSAMDSRGGVMRDGSFDGFNTNIAVVRRNVAPTANNGSLTVPIGSSNSGTLTANNTDCVTPSYSFSVATPPAKGNVTSLNASTGAYTYTATPGQSGADSFTFNVSDGVHSAVAPGTVTVTISNTAPTLAGGTVNAVEGGAPATGTAAATDPDLPAQTMAYRIGTNGTRGTAIIDSATGAYSYTPDAGRMGPDSFTLIVNDGVNDSAPATFTVAIRPSVTKGRFLVSSRQPNPSVVVFNPSNADTGILASLGNVGDAHGVTDGESGVYVLESQSQGLFAVSGGTATSVATASSPPFNSPIGLASELNGNLIVGQLGAGVGRYSPAGATLPGYSGGNLAVSTGVAVGPGGHIWVVDAGAFAGGNNKVVRITIGDGAQTVVNQGGLLNTALPISIAVDTNGDAYVGLSDQTFGPGGTIVKVTSLAITQVATGGLINAPTGITFDASGNLVVANASSGDLVMIDKTNGNQTLLRPSGAPIAQAWDVHLITGKLPGAPTAVSATAGTGQVTVSFSPPLSDGGETITSYTATCGATQVSGSTPSITVTGLATGTPYTCTITATNSIGTGPAASANSVTTNAPVIGTNVGNLTFPTVIVGFATPSQDVTVTNNGTANLVIGTPGIGGTNPGDFAVTSSTCTSATLAPAASCGIQVRFLPTAAGARAASLNIPSNDAVTPSKSVTLSGNGTAQDTTPDAFTFTAASNVARSSVQTSNTVTVAGTNMPAAISVTGGSYSIGCNGTFVTSASTIASGQTVCVRHTASAAFSTATNTTLTIGGVSATFTSTTEGSVTLSVASTGAGTGTITGTGINCPGDCNEVVAPGTVVVLTATASAGSVFGGWTGCDSVNGTQCSVTLTGNRSPSASFNVGAFTLTVAKIGAGSGTVTSTPSGIDCGATCSASFGSGATVQLTATPSATSVFVGWTGDCSGSGACSVTMNAAANVTALFTNPPRMANISTRMQVLTNNDVMIAGFIIGGSVPKTVVVNVAGPSLVPFGITNALADPKVRLVRSSDQSIVKANDNWQAQDTPADVAAITATGFQPNNPAEPAIIATLTPGAYTAIVEGVGGTTGVGLVGVFEVDHPETSLINISTRGQVLTDNDVMIAGFIIQGSGPQRVVVNVAGPNLTNFGIAGALDNPTLTVIRSSDGVVMAANDDWEAQATPGDDTQIRATGFQPNNTREPAVILTLQPGAYTAIVQGVNRGTGVGLVGVFAVP